MKKTIFFTVITALLLSPTLLFAVERIPATIAPSGTTVIVPQQAIDNAPPILEGITIIHYKKDFAKPENPGKPDKPGKPKGESCYGFISGKAKLIETENILINPANSGMTETNVLNTFQTSSQIWDEQSNATDIFGNISINYSATFDTYADGKNEIVFDDYPQAGVIAVIRIWGYFSGKPTLRYIDQFDMIFDTDFVWGDAEVNSALMDLENIATHELGHALGLDDQYSESCGEVTMYGYSTEGEIKKRSLEQPDIDGLQTLYGI